MENIVRPPGVLRPLLLPRQCVRGEFITQAICHYDKLAKEDRLKERDKEKRKRKVGLSTPEAQLAERARRAHDMEMARRLLKGKLKGVFGLVHDSFTLSAGLLLVNVVLKLPTIGEVRAILNMVNADLTPMEQTRLKHLASSNKVMKLFKRVLDRMFSRIDAYRLKQGDRIYPPNTFIVWAREYGTKLKRRHYHLIIGINAYREYSAGPYHCFPTAFGNLSKRIAHVWLETLGLDTHEFVNKTGEGFLTVEGKDGEDDIVVYDKVTGEITNRYKKGQAKSLFGWLVYYPGNKGTRIANSGIFKSRVIRYRITEKDMRWIYKVLSYMLKVETKEIPEEKRKEVKETERTFGCSRQFVP